MFALLRRLLPLLALVAMACVPVGGVPRGFLCDCAGVLRAAAEADCDHGPECQRPEDHRHGQPGHDDEHETELAPLLGSLDGVPAVLPDPAWFVCWWPWQLDDGQRTPAVLTKIGEPKRPPPAGALRPCLAWSTILPHTIALRI